MLAKLGSGYKKPNQQTVVRNRAVAQFLSNMKFTSIRNLGGKLGGEVANVFGTESVSEVLSIPLETFKGKLGEETGTWLYKTIRGIDTTEVITRTEIKSMLSAKSFSPNISRLEQGESWLKVFCADIVSRVNEEVEDPEYPEGEIPASQPIRLRRPRTMTLHHRYNQTTKSRQAPIPLGRVFDEDLLLPIAKHLLRQIEQEGKCWPCNNLSLSVGGFDDVGRGTNRGIGTWLMRGDEAKMLNEESMKRQFESSNNQPTQPERKKRKIAIDTFFRRDATDEPDDEIFVHSDEKEETGFNEDDLYYDSLKDITAVDNPPGKATSRREHKEKSITPPTLRSNSTGRTRFFSKENTPSITNAEVKPPSEVAPKEEESAFPCSRCNNKLIPLHELDEHSDWHFAKDLVSEDRIRPSSAHAAASPTVEATKPTKKGSKPQQEQQPSASQPTPPPVKRGRGRPPKYAIVQQFDDKGPVLEKGQKKLAFGK
ncbi:hypothetical protein ABW21_db0209045 [Orbilia brochopaga]|nr:hypothetical protein ABW21_db0209045 [Drechslerella brochopaga]